MVSASPPASSVPSGLSWTLLSESPAHAGQARQLVEEYVRLPEHWASAGGTPTTLPPAFTEELDRFPGEAVPPTGDVALAVDNVTQRVVGSGLLVRATADEAELKRIYIRPGSPRGTGTALVRLLLERTGQLGYRSVRLDVLASRQRAIHLYEKLGFTEIALYRDYPGHDMRAFGRKVDPAR